MAMAKQIPKVNPQIQALPRNSCLRVTKDQAKQVSVGDKIKVSASGEVREIRKMFDSEDDYEIVLTDSSVSGITGNSADRALKEMMPERALQKAVRKISEEIGKSPADHALDELV